MPNFTIEQLQHDHLCDAWPLVRMSGLEASVDWWVHDATELIHHGGGVLVARAPDGSIHGVATYEVLGEPPLAKVVPGKILVTFELNGNAPVKRTLCKTLEQMQ